MDRDSRTYVAGHRGMVGSALVRRLERDGFRNLLLRSHHELELTDQAAVERFFRAERPEYVFMAAAKVGGIQANRAYPCDFLRVNLEIQTHVIQAAYTYGAKKLLFLGSSCIYPKFAAQPITEESLLTGSLEPTNEWYAIAKIAGLKLCQAYRRQHGFKAVTVMPTNLYGPGDNFDLESAHVLAALIRKCHEAKQGNASTVEIWGTGTPLREFLHVDDLAHACVFLMQEYDDELHINAGWGRDITIGDLASLIAGVVGFRGAFTFNRAMPDGTPRKLLDTSRLRGLGWKPKISLSEGIVSTYRWYVEQEQFFKIPDGTTQ